MANNKFEVVLFGKQRYTLSQLDTLVQDSNETEEGVDALVGDEAGGALIIEALVAEVRRLGGN